MSTSTKMTLNGLELSVNLGWPQGERNKQQIVTLNVTICFPQIPLGCTSDLLTDTYCYDALISTIKTHLIDRNFRLLEHLGYEIHQVIKQTLPPDFKVHIQLTKKPAILNLTGGVTFHFGDN